MKFFDKPITRHDLVNMVNWLSGAPAHRTYNKNNSYNCLLAQYLKEQGRHDVTVSPTNVFYTIDGESYSFKVPPEVLLIAYNGEQSFVGIQEDTFGNALQRAKQLLNMWAT